MKIYEKSLSPNLYLINIKRQGEKTEHLTLYDCTQQECISELKRIISEANPDLFYNGRTTTVEVREYYDRKNGKSMSFSFRGLSPIETKRIIMEALNQ